MGLPREFHFLDVDHAFAAYYLPDFMLQTQIQSTYMAFGGLASHLGFDFPVADYDKYDRRAIWMLSSYENTLWLQKHVYVCDLLRHYFLGFRFTNMVKSMMAIDLSRYKNKFKDISRTPLWAPRRYMQLVDSSVSRPAIDAQIVEIYRDNLKSLPEKYRKWTGRAKPVWLDDSL